MSDQRDELLARIATDVGRIAGALEAIVHRLAVRDGAPRVVCERPPGGGDPLAPVNLATGPDTLFINLRLVGDERATVGPVTVIAGRRQRRRATKPAHARLRVHERSRTP